MANITKTNPIKNVVEMRQTLGANGTKLETVYVNGRPFCCLGSTGMKDREAAIRAIQIAIDSSENMYEAAMKLQQISFIEDAGANPTEQIEVCGEQLLIDYEKKTGYNLVGEEVVNCREINCTDKEAIKAILVSRFESAYNADEIQNWKNAYMNKIRGEEE